MYVKNTVNTFKQDLSSIVKPNANITHELEEKIINIVAEFKSSVEKAARMVEIAFNIPDFTSNY